MLLTRQQKPAWDCRHLTREKAMVCCLPFLPFAVHTGCGCVCTQCSSFTDEQDRLTGASMGTFVIRQSDKSFAALSMVAPNGLYHMHIESDANGCILEYWCNFAVPPLTRPMLFSMRQHIIHPHSISFCPFMMTIISSINTQVCFCGSVPRYSPTSMRWLSFTALPDKKIFLCPWRCEVLVV